MIKKDVLGHGAAGHIKGIKKDFNMTIDGENYYFEFAEVDEEDRPCRAARVIDLYNQSIAEIFLKVGNQ